MKINIFLPLVFIAVLMIPSSCSVTDDPENIEPEIILSEARDITRNEAVISARLQYHGSGRLTYMYFRYGENETLPETTDDMDLSGTMIEAAISGLKPGTTYYYCAEGGNGKAIIRSETKKFTTSPNNVPTVSAAEKLSSGPVGIIINFEIPDDGGSTLISAGCRVSNNFNGNTTTFTIEEKPIKVGLQKLQIVNLSPNTEYSITPYAVNAIGEATGESLLFVTSDAIHLEEPGTLKDLFGNDVFDMDTIRISGRMNGDDFRFLRRIIKAPSLYGESELNSSVHAVDITDADIVKGGGTYDGSRFTSENTITTSLFAECAQLNHIALPSSAQAIMRNAFNGTPLRRIVIPAGITEFEPSANCMQLERIEVSKANSLFHSIDGVLFDYTETKLLWFPIARQGTYSIPKEVTELGQYAFRSCAISSIILPHGLKNLRTGVFSESFIEEISIPDLVTNIPEATFQSCTRLKTITLGEKTNNISNYAFDSCPLTKLYVKAEVPPFANTYAFESNTVNLFEQCTLYVPKGKVAIYRNHSKWGNFKNIVEF